MTGRRSASRYLGRMDQAPLPESRQPNEDAKWLHSFHHSSMNRAHCWRRIRLGLSRTIPTPMRQTCEDGIGPNSFICEASRCASNAHLAGKIVSGMCDRIMRHVPDLNANGFRSIHCGDTDTHFVTHNRISNSMQGTDLVVEAWVGSRSAPVSWSHAFMLQASFKRPLPSSWMSVSFTKTCVRHSPGG